MQLCTKYVVKKWRNAGTVYVEIVGIPLQLVSRTSQLLDWQYNLLTYIDQAFQADIRCILCAIKVLDVWIQIVWEDENFEGVDINTQEGLEQFMRSEPELEFVNQVKMERMYSDAANSRSVHTDTSDGKTYLQCVRRYTGMMKDLGMNIKNFPFDSQVLEVEIQAFGCPVQRKDFRQLCRIVPCRIEDIRYSSCSVQEMLNDGQQYYLSELHGLESLRFELMGARTQVEAVKYDFLGIYYSKLVLTFTVQRRWQYYRSKIFSVLFLIVLLSFLVFGFSIQEFEQRLNVLITLFLAGVAFQFTTSEAIPQVGYMTRLDRYLMVTYGFLASVGYESVLVNRLDLSGDTELANSIEKYSLYGFPAAWIVYNVCFFTAALLMRRAQRKQFTRFPWSICIDNKTPSPEQVQAQILAEPKKQSKFQRLGSGILDRITDALDINEDSTDRNGSP
eukprot:m.125151 g.125151  ORF g.125151 m.125151 type:complete len:447 (+) comp17317_c0_seq2:1025-2365(+)